MAIVFRGSVLSFIQMEAFIKGYNGKFNYKMDKNNFESINLIKNKIKL